MTNDTRREAVDRPELHPGEYIVNLGAIHVPTGYFIVANGSHYYGIAPDGTAGPIHWRRQSALWWCKRHAEGRST